MYNLGEEKLIIYCDYNDVQRIIEAEYGFKEYNIACAEELVNDVTYECDVDGEVDEWDKKDIDARKQQYNTRAYMNDLARQKLIKKGVYMIRISW